MIKIPDLKNTVQVTKQGEIKHFLKEDAERVMDSIVDRSFRYPITSEEIIAKKRDSFILRENGWLKKQGALSHKIDVIDSISERLNYILDGGTIEVDSDLGRQVTEQGCNILNQSEARHNQLFLSVPEPLYNVPQISDIIFDDNLVSIAKSFFECMPAIGTLNLRKSFANDLNPEATTLYHVDPNSPYFFKAFVYLKDVDTPEDGPFTYVEGSVDKKPENLTDQYRWSDDEIENFYGSDKIKHLTAKKGDLLMADTNGWHRGTKPLNKDRTMLTLDYVCHVEFFQEDSKFKIKSEDYNKLEDKYKPLCDLLIKV